METALLWSHPRLPLAAILAISAAMLSVAFTFQYVGGLAPCTLCIYQRIPYALIIGLTVLALPFAPLLGARVVTAGIALCGCAFAAGAVVAGFHVGVENGWWEGLSSCGSHISPDLDFEEFKRRLLAAPVVRCDEVAWSMFGVSMAGYNFLASVVFAGGSFIAAKQVVRIGHGNA